MDTSVLQLDGQAAGTFSTPTTPLAILIPPPFLSLEHLYGSTFVNVQMGITGSILILCGLQLMIFGFRCFRTTLAIVGFLMLGKFPPFVFKPRQIENSGTEN
jgi:hypothetical protein